MHVLITGASAGIGEALARRIADDPALAGAHVSLVARSEARLRALAEELSTVVARAFVADLSRPDEADRVLAEAEAWAGPVDLLFNNAGSQVVGPTAAVDLDRAEASLTLDLVTPLRLIHRVLPGMQARGHGRIVNVASMAALAPTPGMTWYNAAKGGLAAASEALRGELGGTGVTVTTVYPGFIQTDMADAALEAYGSSLAIRLQPIATTQELAAAVVPAVLSGRARVVYPRWYALSRWFPAPTRWLMDTLTPTPAVAA